jgi:site-specific DNA-methyltransferase (adenine-specific)
MSKHKKISIDKILINPNNPRLIKDDKFKKLCKSIQEFPEMLELRPIVVNKDMIVLGGNMRLKACQEIGLTEVPIIVAENLTEEQQREFLIKDNVSGGEWDWDILANEWEVEQLTEWGLDVPINLETELEAVEDDFNEEPPEEPITILGDLYEIGEHRLLCGDSTDSDQVAKLMNGQKADMVFTDPPYGVEIKGKFTGTILNDNLQGDEFDDFLTACFNNLKLFNKGNLYISYEIKNHTIFENALLSSGFVFDEIIIWNKDSASFYSNNKYNRKFEPIFFIENGKELKCKPDVNVWDFAKSSSFASRDENNKRFNEDGNYLVAHPTTKPLGLITKPLNNSTKENDLILDLFLGSGSTMVASHQLKRKCYGMELDPKYCDVIVKRMIKLDPSIKVKRNGQLIDNKQWHTTE